MCGRYALYGPVSRLREAFDAVPEGFEFEPRWNAAPLQWLPVVRQRSNGERVIHRLRWGLVPSWSKDEAIATSSPRSEQVSSDRCDQCHRLNVLYSPFSETTPTGSC